MQNHSTPKPRSRSEVLFRLHIPRKARTLCEQIPIDSLRLVEEEDYLDDVRDDTGLSSDIGTTIREASNKGLSTRNEFLSSKSRSTRKVMPRHCLSQKIKSMCDELIQKRAASSRPSCRRKMVQIRHKTDPTCIRSVLNSLPSIQEASNEDSDSSMNEI